jgi:hypothetical protein
LGGPGLGPGFGLGVGSGVGLGFGFGVGFGVGSGAGFGLGFGSGVIILSFLFTQLFNNIHTNIHTNSIIDGHTAYYPGIILEQASVTRRVATPSGLTDREWVRGVTRWESYNPIMTSYTEYGTETCKWFFINRLHNLNVE